jgi:putative oxidoreductase
VLAIAIEAFGGALPVSGYEPRIAAAVLALYCVATTLSFNANAGDPNRMMQFLKTLCMAGGLLQGVAFGAAASSIDYFRDCDPSMNFSAAGTDVRA